MQQLPASAACLPQLSDLLPVGSPPRGGINGLVRYFESKARVLIDTKLAHF